MTVLSRGARNRRAAAGRVGSSLTVLLFLAIVSSSALVFTNRVDLLKLAVVIALWRPSSVRSPRSCTAGQSDTDQAACAI